MKDDYQAGSFFQLLSYVAHGKARSISLRAYQITYVCLRLDPVVLI